MRKLVRFLEVVFLVLLTSCQGAPLQSHVDYANEIINSLTEDLQKEYGLICIGSGGRMSRDVETIKLFFNRYQQGTIAEARELLIEVREKLVSKVNTHEKIRPHLREYPFTWQRVEISIAFHKPNTDSYYLDGSVALVSSARGGKIAYDRVELQKRKAPDFHDSDGSVRIGKITEDEVFVLLLEEPYEEALRIVKSGVNADQNVVKTP